MNFIFVKLKFLKLGQNILIYNCIGGSLISKLCEMYDSYFFTRKLNQTLNLLIITDVFSLEFFVWYKKKKNNNFEGFIFIHIKKKKSLSICWSQLVSTKYSPYWPDHFNNPIEHKKYLKLLYVQRCQFYRPSHWKWTSE